MENREQPVAHATDAETPVSVAARETPACTVPLPETTDHVEEDWGEDFVFRREVGRGGLGRVVEVYQKSLDRTIVLKELRPHRLSERVTSRTAASHFVRFANEGFIHQNSSNSRFFRAKV